MELLLKMDQAGNILAGSEQLLSERASRGDDLTIYIDAPGYDEYIIFGNYIVSAGRVSALSLPHLAHGDLSEPAALDRGPLSTSQYVYDSGTNNALIKEIADEREALTTVFTNNPYYRSYIWYSTRHYVDADFSDLERLKACGDQFKVRIDLTTDFTIVLKPDIIYFPYQRTRYLVKSASMVLPTSFASDPTRYVESGIAVTNNQAFSLAYLNIDAEGLLTIVHKERFKADKKVDNRVSEGKLVFQAAGPTRVTRLKCGHTILVPHATHLHGG